MSLFPLLAYHKICNDHYRNEKWQPYEPWTCNIDYLLPTSNMNAYSFISGDTVTSLMTSILDLEFLKRVISDFEIDTIYHLAAQSIVRIANKNPLYALNDNIIGTANVLEAVRQINPNIRVLCASSRVS